MIVPPGEPGVAFTEAADGDMRSDPVARAAVAARLGVGPEWASVSQVHGAGVIRVSAPGAHGTADALWTTTVGVPVAVFTADCFGVVVRAPGAVGVAHTGWRGTAAGVVEALIAEMSSQGHTPQRAVVGPGIGPCCFEVGPEVASFFPDQSASTSWSTPSVDLPSAIRQQLGGLVAEVLGGCTRHQDRFFSHRRNATSERLAAIGWME